MRESGLGLALGRLGLRVHGRWGGKMADGGTNLTQKTKLKSRAKSPTQGIRIPTSHNLDTRGARQRQGTASYTLAQTLTLQAQSISDKGMLKRLIGHSWATTPHLTIVPRVIICAKPPKAVLVQPASACIQGHV